ncbi:acyl-CoA thioesterase [Chitinophaga japonensis]|uniref:Acyl-CoA thioesterase FadM n=1 Tax=Chitinophaga japonensis TaxID=104662 RepID=A0A562T3E5_CHIJA|nr:thioesterase family protein [Chitinophaga japonensis]TWI88089.1 acyl-CoA thioesterase FadM [Chitinophaga japonensis]
MARIKLTLPGTFGFKTRIPVRIQDLNYGRHVGNDAILSIIHEARIQYLASQELKEVNDDGTGLIMADVAVIYKGEGFYGDIFEVEVAAAEYTATGFDLYYRITALRDDATVLIAEAKTGMVCFDYEQHKVTRLPDTWKAQLV